MLKKSLLLTTCFTVLLVTDLLAADWLKSSAIDLSLGYRVDQLDWNIAGNSGGSNPNVLSELDWDDLEIFQLQLDARVETDDLLWLNANTLFVARCAYGSIFGGDNRDSDYAGDNRTQEWSRSENQSDDGYTLDLSGGFGPKYELFAGKLTLAPLVGYALNMQRVEITEGIQTVSDSSGGKTPAPLGPIADLDSTYTAYWYGPWLGIRTQILPASSWSLEAAAEYHWVDYFAEADWNLRDELAHPVSFDHDASGQGWVLSAKSHYQISPHWAATCSGNWQVWETDAGIDTTYKADGSRSGTRLNQVNWSSYALLFGLRYQF